MTDVRGVMAEDVQALEGDCATAGSTARSAAPIDVEDDISAHEGQASDLAARPGAMLLDYVRATLPDDRETRAALAEWVGPSETRAMGWRGWYDSSATVLDGGLIAWCRDPERAEVQGLLVDLPGRACACLGERLVPFLAWCCEVGHVTRADYAIDDREGRLTLERVLSAVRSGAVVTRWREARPLVSYDLQTGERTGWTVYLGSRRSDAMVRIYDKRAQQGGDGEPWVRLEFETKGDLAHNLACAYFEEGSAAVVGQLARRVRFAVVDPTDTNKRRWATAPWWAAVVGSVAPGPSLLCGERQEVTVAALQSYIERQAGPSMAAVTAARGGDTSWWYAMLERSRHRMKPKHRAAVSLFQRQSVAVGVLAE